MRIILDYRPALRERTGVGEYVHELAGALAAAGANDRVVAFSSSWKDRLDTSELPAVEPIDARVPVHALNLAWHRLGWPPIERFTGPADVAHSAHPLLMPARRAAQVITIHDLDFLDHPERTRREIRRDYPSLAADHARRADLVVVSSRTTADQVVNGLGVDERRIALCPAGAPDWPARSGPPVEGYYLFVGTLEPRKNVGTLLSAYARLLTRLPDAPRLTLAGRAGPAAAEWLTAVDRLGLRGRVEHLGYVAPERKRELYEGAAALVIPSLYEGFGLTALEAMTVGVPVIASRRGSLPEVLGDVALFFEPTDEAALAESMWRIATDAMLVRQLAAAGRTRAATFSWSRTAGVLRRAYDDAVRRRQERS